MNRLPNVAEARIDDTSPDEVVEGIGDRSERDEGRDEDVGSRDRVENVGRMELRRVIVGFCC